MGNSTTPKLVRPVIIGLIGGVASGKSFVGSLLEAEGALRIDADRLGHEVLQTAEVRKQLTDQWGQSLLYESGEIDRAKLAKLVFGESSEVVARRRQLESIVHPRIRALAQARIAAARSLPEPPLAIVIDAPLLLEAGWEKMCDLILFIETPLEERLSRAASRGWTAEQFHQREASQMPLDEKRKHATHIIDNGQRTHVELPIKHLWQQIVRNSA